MRILIVSGRGRIRFHPAFVIAPPTSVMMRSMKNVVAAAATATRTPKIGRKTAPKSMLAPMSPGSTVLFPWEFAVMNAWTFATAEFALSFPSLTVRRTKPEKFVEYVCCGLCWFERAPSPKSQSQIATGASPGWEASEKVTV